MITKMVPLQAPCACLRRRYALHQPPLRGLWFLYRLLGDYVRDKKSRRRMKAFEPQALQNYRAEMLMMNSDPFHEQTYQI